ncbi:YolD-like family protein [Paenibacillus taichungensis]|uniref:YolD-like family protein n=1 Tax=Paenibacillus taichungensis TaxID=484184 RepID=A0ABX2MCL0_9BACL|nr:YolD-like family protein [Paenibacillus taichungensis]NUU52700.1 YolD-like family protein [Paenibacillus taichungensis]
MSSKLNANGVYEGSRMILPEHREAYLAHMHEINRKEKPILDEQEWQLIGLTLMESYQERVAITLTVFDPFDDSVMRGVVDQIDQNRKVIKFVRGDEDYSFIPFKNILSASV